jgi:anti-sigma factor RsiW
MTCGEVREMLFVFLDNELDAALSIDVQRHVEHCPDCAREVEIERAIQKGLARATDRNAANVPTLEVMSRTMFDGQVGKRPRFVGRRHMTVRAWMTVGASIAGVILLAVSVQRLIPTWEAPSRDTQLAGMLVADFERFLDKGRPVQIASTDRAEVSRWLHGKTGLPVSLPEMKGHCKLVGGRKCKLNGRPAAFASYDMGDSPACVIVLEDRPDALKRMTPLTRNGTAFWVDRLKDHSIVVRQQNDLIYAAVARAEIDEVIHMLTELD